MKAQRRRDGQTMVETSIAMIVVLLVFLALYNLSDLTRVKLLVENAAVKCARARAVGYNDFMLRKIARLTTMPVAGECKTLVDSGEGKLPYSARYYRIGSYLMSEYEAQANVILDFEYWRRGNTLITASDGHSHTATATATQRRPQLFGFGALVGEENPDEDDLAAAAKFAAGIVG